MCHVCTSDKEASVRERRECRAGYVYGCQGLDMMELVKPWNLVPYSLSPHTHTVIMGSAYLVIYIGVEQDPKLLKQCVSAYLNAVSHTHIHCELVSQDSIPAGGGPQCCL